MENQFTGEIDLIHLPDEVEDLRLSDNQLTGEIHLTHSPKRMKYLYLKNNQFSGSLVIKGLPQGMNMIDVRGNQFNTIAVVDSETHVSIKLKGSGVTSAVDGNGAELDMDQFLK